MQETSGNSPLPWLLETVSVEGGPPVTVWAFYNTFGDKYESIGVWRDHGSIQSFSTLAKSAERSTIYAVWL